MNDRTNERTVTAFIVALLFLLAVPPNSAAAVQEPAAAEPRPSARRTAARAIERRSSTQWLSDVAERLRVLKEDTERAATRSDTTRGAQSPSLAPGRKPR